MSPEQFAVLWEAKHEKLSSAHRDLMLEQLVGFNIRAIDDKWILKALQEDGLKKLVDIIYTALEYQDEAIAEAEKKTVPTQQPGVVIQGNPRSSFFREEKRTIGELWALCNDTNPLKRVRAAESSQSIPAMLSQLAGDVKEFVREAVAGNPKAATETLELLSADTASAVRLRVASNSRTPLKALEKLLSDEDQKVREAAEVQSKQPRKYIASDAFYSIGMTMDEGIHPDVILLDANVILLLEEWARSTCETKGFGDLNESVRPLLKVLRETKFATFEQGALESAWPSPKKDVTQTEKLVAFNKSRMTDLLNLITFLRNGSEADAELWLDSNREAGLKWGSAVPNNFDFEKAKLRILEAWMIACLLIDHISVMEENEETSKIHEINLGTRIRYFKEFLQATENTGLQLEGELLFLARMGFFGGRIRFGSRSFDFADISKKVDWVKRGTLAVGRNIAMDVALMRVARELRLSSSAQGTLKTSIITGDLGLLAIFQYIVKEWRDEESGRTLVSYEWPPDSEIYRDSRAFHGMDIAHDPVDIDSSNTSDADWLLRELLIFSE
ncbi:hypothetical protein MCEMRE130_00110 [Candidatus Nanopelagicaceae bacterium]